MIASHAGTRYCPEIVARTASAFWLAVALTLWTGWEYARETVRAGRERRAHRG